MQKARWLSEQPREAGGAFCWFLFPYRHEQAAHPFPFLESNARYHSGLNPPDDILGSG